MRLRNLMFFFSPCTGKYALCKGSLTCPYCVCSINQPPPDLHLDEEEGHGVTAGCTEDPHCSGGGAEGWRQVLFFAPRGWVAPFARSRGKKRKEEKHGSFDVAFFFSFPIWTLYKSSLGTLRPYQRALAAAPGLKVLRCT